MFSSHRVRVQRSIKLLGPGLTQHPLPVCSRHREASKAPPPQSYCPFADLNDSPARRCTGVNIAPLLPTPAYHRTYYRKQHRLPEYSVVQRRSRSPLSAHTCQDATRAHHVVPMPKGLDMCMLEAVQPHPRVFTHPDAAMQLI